MSSWILLSLGAPKILFFFSTNLNTCNSECPSLPHMTPVIYVCTIKVEIGMCTGLEIGMSNSQCNFAFTCAEVSHLGKQRRNFGSIPHPSHFILLILLIHFILSSFYIICSLHGAQNIKSQQGTNLKSFTSMPPCQRANSKGLSLSNKIQYKIKRKNKNMES